MRSMRGIPLSRDRVEYRRRIVMLTTVYLTGAAIVAVLVVLVVLDTSRRPPGRELSPVDLNMEAELEGLRALSYEAMQEQAQRLLTKQGFKNVFWRENEHVLKDGTFRFDGIVDIDPGRGDLERSAYSAQVRKNAVGEWELVGLEVGGASVSMESGSIRSAP